MGILVDIPRKFFCDYLIRKHSLKIPKNDTLAIASIFAKGINDKIVHTDDFNILWKRLIKIKQLYVSNVMPKKWFTVDNVENYRTLRKK